MRALELRVPPPLAAIAAAASIWLLARAVPELTFAFPGQFPAWLILVATGTAIDAAALLKFVRMKTTINPISPEKASALATRGIYRLSRNPMYLGLAFLLAGWTLWLGNPLGALIVAGFVAYLTRFQIVPEERVLLKLFGTEYQAYCRDVGRWL